ncbi:MAG: putative RDD family membrane protein YckC [Arenicella sp.]|jgi:uncharacterized RDD family membrane protein YckC
MQNIGFFKRLLVIIYDGLLLVSVVFFTSALWMALFTWLGPDIFFTTPDPSNPNLIERSDLGRAIGGVIVSINIICVSFFFYGWFWTHGGQTLGMKAWNLYLVQPNGKFIDWNTAFKRYLAAILSLAFVGLGFTWALLDSRKRTWHDILTNTQIIKSKQQGEKDKLRNLAKHRAKNAAKGR